MRYLLIISLLLFTYCTLNTKHHISKHIIPLKMCTIETSTRDEILIETISKYFNINDRKLVRYTVEISHREGIDPLFIASLIWTESRYMENAVSRKGYKGLTQIPWFVPWADMNITAGIRILREKYDQTGDVIKSIIAYKGYRIDDPRGKQQAEKVLHHWREMRELRNRLEIYRLDVKGDDKNGKSLL